MMDKVSHAYLQLAMQISMGKYWGFLFMDLLTKMIQDSNFTLFETLESIIYVRTTFYDFL